MLTDKADNFFSRLWKGIIWIQYPIYVILSFWMLQNDFKIGLVMVGISYCWLHLMKIMKGMKIE